MIVLVIGLFLLIYAALNYYIGIRGFQLLSLFTGEINGGIYWSVFWFIALSYVFSKLLGNVLPNRVLNFLDYSGSYWMAIMLYSILIIVLVDIFKLINNKFEILYINSLYISILGISIVAFLMFLLIYGTWSATNTVVNKYEIKISKESRELKNLNIVMASDIHIGSAGYKDRMIKLVEQTNSIKPDIVLLVGDIIDDSVEPFIDNDMGKYLRQINSRLGIYAVTGNHEYISGKANEFVEILRECGVTVLQDDVIKIKDSFYLIGRNDVAGERYYGEKRKELSEIVENIDDRLPIILMDHQPKNLSEALNAGVDLQLSGHTHRGQLSPSNIITKKLFEVDWGYLKKEDLNVIVSSGFGTWGPPIRIGSRSELVNILISFQ